MNVTQNKTVKTDASVDEFIASIAHPTRRQDAAVLVDLFSKVTGYAPKMWGDSIVGFGQYHYRYATGREGDFLATGFHRANPICRFTSCQAMGTFPTF
jgi:hypothetical protein